MLFRSDLVTNLPAVLLLSALAEIGAAIHHHFVLRVGVCGDLLCEPAIGLALRLKDQFAAVILADPPQGYPYVAGVGTIDSIQKMRGEACHVIQSMLCRAWMSWPARSG